MKHDVFVSTAIEECMNRLCTVYPKAAKRSIPCAPPLLLNGSTVIIAAAKLLAYN